MSEDDRLKLDTENGASDHDFVDDLDLTREIDLGDIFGEEKEPGDLTEDMDLTREIDLGDIFGEEAEPEKKAEGVSDETMVLSADDLADASGKKREEDLDKTMVLGIDEIPNPWRDEEDEVLELFGKEGRTKIYPKNEDLPQETAVLDRKALKSELSEEEEAARRDQEEPAEGAGCGETGSGGYAEEGVYAEESQGKRKHYKSHFFLKAALLLIAFAATAAFACSPVFTIKNIVVEGNRFYTDEQIINMSAAETGGNLFLDAQKGKIRKNLGDDLYFKEVKVKRRIPATLVIDVEEREELAGVKYGDRYVVIDEDAMILRVARLDPEVTQITGLKIKKMEPGSEIQVEEERIFRDTLATLHTMKEGDLFFKKIEIEDQTSTAFIYDMLKVRGSSEQLRAAIESGTLQKVVNKLMKNKIRRGTIILGEDNYISFSPAL